MSTIDWQPRWENLLGTVSDDTVAKMIGIAPATVQTHRRKLGISAYPVKGNTTTKDRADWDFWDQYLGTCSDATLARVLQRSHVTVYLRRKRLGIPAFDPWRDLNWNNVQLGKESDPVIARQLGCPVSLVKQKREEQGIPSKNIPTAWETLPLGVLSDCAIARATGRAQCTVTLARQRLGIRSPKLTPFRMKIPS